MKKLVYFLVVVMLALVCQSYVNPTKTTKKVAKDSTTSITVNADIKIDSKLDEGTSNAITELVNSTSDFNKARLELIKGLMEPTPSDKEKVIRKACAYYGVTEADFIKLNNQQLSIQNHIKWIIILSLLGTLLFILYKAYKQKWKIWWSVLILTGATFLLYLMDIAASNIALSYTHPYREIINLIQIYQQ